MQQYKLEELKNKDSYVCTEVYSSMYEFPQAGMLAHKDLIKRLIAHRYTTITSIIGL